MADNTERGLRGILHDQGSFRDQSCVLLCGASVLWMQYLWQELRTHSSVDVSVKACYTLLNTAISRRWAALASASLIRDKSAIDEYRVETLPFDFACTAESVIKIIKDASAQVC
jgi:hypothetical protein